MPEDVVYGVDFTVKVVVAVDAMIRLMPYRNPGPIHIVADDANAYAFQAQRSWSRHRCCC